MSYVLREVLADVQNRPLTGLPDELFSSSTGVKVNEQASSSVSIFLDLVESAGCPGFRHPGRVYEGVEVVDPRRLRHTILTSLCEGKTSVNDFVAGLKDMLQDVLMLRRSLLPVRVLSPGAYVSGDSFLRIVINIPALQPHVCQLLLQKVIEHAQDAEEEEEEDDEGGLAALILGQLRWLEAIVDRRALVRDLLDALLRVPEPLVGRMLTLLPEIAREEDCECILPTLNSLLARNLGLLPNVLDALEGLSIGPTDQARVVASMTARLEAVKTADLPALAAYLVTHAPNIQSAEMVIRGLRRALSAAMQPSPPAASITDVRENRNDNGENVSQQLVERLAVTLPRSAACVDVLLRDLEAANGDVSSLTVLDFWLLLILHASKAKAVEGVMRSVAAASSATAVEAWIHKAVSGHQAAVAPVWPALLAIAAHLCAKRSEPLVSAAGATLYVSSFAEMSTGTFRSDVLAALQTHLGTGVEAEVGTALKALSKLAREHPVGLAAHASQLTSAIDYLETFTDSQLEELFDIFMRLGSIPDSEAASVPSEAKNLLQEVEALVGRCLVGATSAQRRIGVLGYLAQLASLARGAETAEKQGQLMEAAALTSTCLERADELLLRCVQHSELASYMFDRLADMVESGRMAMGASLLAGLHERVQGTFEAAFVDDAASSSQDMPVMQLPGCPPIPTREWLNLDGDLKVVYIKIWPLAASDDPRERQSLLWFGPCFRALSALELLSHPDLSDIDALLGCPLGLPPLSVYALYDSEGEGASANSVHPSIHDLPKPAALALITALAAALSWCREVVNAFANLAGRGSATLTDVDGKVCQRLAHVLQLEELLRNTLTAHPAAAALAAGMPRFACPLAAVSKKGATSSNTRAFTPAAIGNLLRTASRPFRPSALSALQALTSTSPGSAGERWRLAAAAVLAQEVQSKTSFIISRARGGFGCGNLSDPTVESLSLPSFLGLLQPLLPLLVQHLTSASTALASDRHADADVSGDASAAVSHGDGTAMLAAVDAVGREMEAVQCGTRYINSVLATLRLLLNSVSMHPSGFTTALYAALAGTTTPAPSPLETAGDAAASLCQAGNGRHIRHISAEEMRALPSLCCTAFKVLSCLSTRRRAHVAPDFSLDLILVRTLVALLTVLEKLSGNRPLHEASPEGEDSINTSTSSGLDANSGALAAPPSLPALRAAHDQLSRMALLTLESTWGGGQVGSAEPPERLETGQPGDEGEAMEVDAEGGTVSRSRTGFCWRGQHAAITELLRIHVMYAPDPPAALLHLSVEVLPQVPPSVPSKRALEAVAGISALCDSTFAAWHRGLLECVVEALTSSVQRAQAPSKTGELARDEALAAATAHAASLCSQAFSALLTQCRSHGHRLTVLAPAIKCGAAFVECVMRGVPVWRALWHMGLAPDVLSVVRETQKGTRVMQVLCVEAKRRGATSVSSKVPAVKRALEKFIFTMKAFFVELGQPEAIWLGTLKHRDLQGNAVASQMFPEDMEEEEEAPEDQEDNAAEGANTGKSGKKGGRKRAPTAGRGRSKEHGNNQGGAQRKKRANVGTHQETSVVEAVFGENAMNEENAQSDAENETEGGEGIAHAKCEEEWDTVSE